MFIIHIPYTKIWWDFEDKKYNYLYHTNIVKISIKKKKKKNVHEM